VQSTEPLTAEQEIKILNKKLAESQKQLLESKLAQYEQAEKEKIEAEKKPEVLKPVKCNMYEDAAKTVSEYKGVEVPKMVSPLEAGHYHLLCVRSEGDDKTKKYTFAQRSVVFTVAGYQRHKKSYVGSKKEEWIMYHNPLKK